MTSAPTWGSILGEVTDLRAKGDQLSFDTVRRKYLHELSRYTGRDTILYATAWTLTKPLPAEPMTINFEDVQGFMEAVHGLRGKGIDLILHSPGGTSEAAEAIVNYLRKKFDDLRVIIPHGAMSAATLLACAANRIVMGKQSFLGPIDPQLIVSTQIGVQVVPAQSILDQFAWAKEECKDPRQLGAWLPILSQYGPALLVQCEDAIELSEELATVWLTNYMLARAKDRKRKAKSIAKQLADHAFFKSHGRPVDRDLARRMGLAVDDLESDQQLQDLVLSVYHAASITMDAANVVKIIENQNGKAFIKNLQVVVVGQPPPGQGQPQVVPPQSEP